MNPETALQIMSPGSSWKIERSESSAYSITPQDIAASLGMGNLSRYAEIVGYAILEQPLMGGIDEFVDQVIRDVADRQIREKWQTDKPEILNNLAHFAYFEITHPKGCKKCHGTGQIKTGMSFDACKNCLGTGAGSYSGEWIADSCEIAYSKWRSTWKARYLHVYNAAARYKYELFDHIRRHT